jgi:hypothetical protein
VQAPGLSLSPTVLAGIVRQNSRAVIRAEVVLHALGLIAVSLLFWMAITRAPTTSSVIQACANKVDWGPTRGSLLLVAGILGPVAGRLVAWVRFHARGGPGTIPPPGPLFGLAFAGLLVLATLLLIYETVATNGGPPPITSYVRCAFGTQLQIALPVTFGVGFMFSSWLWYPK